MRQGFQPLADCRNMANFGVSESNKSRTVGIWQISEFQNLTNLGVSEFNKSRTVGI
jgi:hypothetical protein